jgi:glycosyltransferase involved in cell wall biosynthesis
MHIVLFFTRGVSLGTWEQNGSLSRETALYKAIRSRSHEVTFVTYGDAGDLRHGGLLSGITVLCNRWGLPRRTYEHAIPFLHASKLRKGDVYKTNQTYGSEIALRAARFWRKPLVARCGYMWSEFEARRAGPESSETREALGLEARVFGRARRILVTTPAMAKDISMRVPQAAGTVVVIPNYVDTDRFAPRSDRRLEWDVVFVGRLSPQKNVATLLEAVRPLDVRISLIGDGELREALERQATGMNGRVVWRGNLPNTELPGELCGAKVFVLPSLYEGHPKALIEAMSCGLPVIGTDVPGIREVIRHGETGWLCRPDVASLREAIRTLMLDGELRARLGRCARDYATENFSLDKIVGMELAVLEEAVKAQ